MTASFAVFEASGGARIFRLPMQAFPNFWAYAYAVQADSLVYLIDTGSGTDTSHTDLLSGLQRAGLSPSDLTHILLTHAHIDHYGGLSKLKPLTNAKIGCHDLDLQTVAHPEARLALTSRRLASFLAETGLAKDGQDQLLHIYRFTKSLHGSVPVDFTLRHSFQSQGGAYEAIQDHVPGLEVIHLPGHCPGHVAMRLGDVIFCGDMVVEGVTPHLTPESIMPYSGLDHYLESLQRFQHWANGARLILNGHDEAITDLPKQIEATRNNIIRRMSRAMSTLTKPLTVSQVCNLVYKNPNGYNLLLTIEKTGAYIEYLYEHGMIEIVNADEVEKGQPAQYRRLGEISDSEILLKERNHVFI
jgi:glyoxylase-like metal-dependent hydrolase (beta-lactamase superfamily II)